MADDTQEFIVESEATAKALNAKYVPPTETMPVDFAALGIQNPVIWLEKPNVRGEGRPTEGREPRSVASGPSPRPKC